MCPRSWEWGEPLTACNSCSCHLVRLAAEVQHMLRTICVKRVSPLLSRFATPELQLHCAALCLEASLVQGCSVRQKSTGARLISANPSQQYKHNISVYVQYSNYIITNHIATKGVQSRSMQPAFELPSLKA